MTVAYIGGTFDMLHYGHVRLFRAAHEIYDKVVVSLNTDEFATRYKRVPVMSLAERIEMVESVRYVDQVVVNVGNENSTPAILSAGATHIVHGSDWTGESLQKQLGLTDQWLKDHGIEMVILPYTGGVSSTEIIERIYDDAHI